MNKRNGPVIITIIILVCLLVSCKTSLSSEEESQVEENTNLFYNNLREKCIDFNEIELKSLTPFEWDELYIFGVYYPLEKIYEKIGSQWEGLRSSMVEYPANMVFLKDEKIVCYYYDDSFEKQKFIFYDVYEAVVYAADNPKIKVKEFWPTCTCLVFVNESS